MRSCFLVLVLAACELVPAPKPAPPPPAAPARVPEPAPADAGPVVAPDAMEVSDACLAVGVKVSEILIAEAADASERNALEQQRATIVRRTAEACTGQKWSDDLFKCVAASKKKVDLAECEKKFVPRPAQPAQIPTPDRVPTIKSAPAPAGNPAPPVVPKNGDPNAIRPRVRPKP